MEMLSRNEGSVLLRDLTCIPLKTFTLYGATIVMTMAIYESR
jgi:hypothetical protein